MAGGKLTPRQKMINMMYLVLTAMLALNVSWEVLQAFVNMEEGFQQTMDIVRKDNHKVFQNFAKIAEEQPAKSEPYFSQAKELKNRAAILYKYIDSLKYEIVLQSEGEESKAITEEKTVVASAIENLDDTNTGSRFLVGNEVNRGIGYELKDKIDAHKDFLLSLIEHEDNKNEVITTTIQELLSTERKNARGTVKEATNEGGARKTWAQAMFENTPIISSIALLSTIQMNVLNTEANVLNYLMSKVSEDDFKFSNVQVIVRSTTDYVVKGSEFKAEIFLAAYNDTDDSGMTLNIGGREIKPGSDGKIHYTSLSTTPGPISIPGKLRYKMPSGEEVTEPLTINYQVVEPVATVSPSKMNVLYAGIDNPLDISVGAGVTQDKIKAEMNGAPIKRASGGGFVVSPPTDAKTCVISVSAEVNGEWKKMGSSTFRVKQVPIPAPAVDGITGRTATKGELASSQGLRALMPSDFEFDLRMTVVSFTISTVDNQGYVKDESSQSMSFTEAQRGMFKNLRQGGLVTFTSIKAKNNATGAIVDLNDLVIKVK